MSIKLLSSTLILSTIFIFIQPALADSNSTQQLLSKQYVANPNNFHSQIHPKFVPTSISHCEQSLLACAERALSYEQAELDLDTDTKLGKDISIAEIFIYPQPTLSQAEQSDIGVVVITKNVTKDDSVAGVRHRIAFVQQKDSSNNHYWKFVSHRYQWQCMRGREGWSKQLCP